MLKLTFEYCLIYTSGQQYTTWIHASTQEEADKVVREEYGAETYVLVSAKKFEGMVQGIFC